MLHTTLFHLSSSLFPAYFLFYNTWQSCGPSYPHRVTTVVIEHLICHRTHSVRDFLSYSIFLQDTRSHPTSWQVKNLKWRGTKTASDRMISVTTHRPCCLLSSLRHVTKCQNNRNTWAMRWWKTELQAEFPLKRGRGHESLLTWHLSHLVTLWLTGFKKRKLLI